MSQRLSFAVYAWSVIWKIQWRGLTVAAIRSVGGCYDSLWSAAAEI